MTTAAGHALEQALAYYRAPGLLPMARERPLPDDVLDVLRIAGGDAATTAQLAESSGESPATVSEASVFFVQQVLFANGADSYRVLGVNDDAPDARIKEHYRWLVRWLHPDRNVDDWDSVYADRVNVAWQTLRLPERRREYDQRRAASLAAGANASAAATDAAPSPAAPVKRQAAGRYDEPQPAVLSSRAVQRLPAIVLGALGAGAVSILALMWITAEPPPARPAPVAEVALEPAALRESLAPTPDVSPPVQASEPQTVALATPTPEASAPTGPVPPAATAAAPGPGPAGPTAPAASPRPALAMTATQPAPPVLAAPAPVPAAQPAPPRPAVAAAPPAPERPALAAAQPAPERPVVAAAQPASERPATVAAQPAPPKPPVPAAQPAPAAPAVAAPAPALAQAPAPRAPTPAPAPVAAPALEGEMAARALATEFSRAYGAGDINALMRLFTADARNNRGGRDAIVYDYQSLFSGTERRELRVIPTGWMSRNPDEGTLLAEYEASVTALGKRRAETSRGQIRFDMRRVDGRYRISQVRHDDSL